MIKHKRAILFSGLVLVSQVIQGLFLHPYQTMQNLVKEKVFVWLSFAPLFFLLLSLALNWLVGQLVAWQLFKPVINFVFAWWLIFLSYWQALLTYLLLRFVWAFWAK